MAAHDSADRALGQVLAADGVEINAARHLIDTLESETASISADALHCCTETAQLTLDRGFDYLLCAKGNRPELYASAKALSQGSDRQRLDHSRARTRPRQDRTVKTLQVGEAVRIAFPGARQLVRVRRRRRSRTTGKASHETVFYLTSRDARSLRPAESAAGGF